LALPRRRRIAQRIEAAKPDAIHIATEGPIGHMVRGYCRRQGRRFTTSYTTRFPEYISARAPIPEAWIYAATTVSCRRGCDDDLDPVAHDRIE
jgi:hypothetical protein